MLKSLTHALRVLRKDPIFSAVAIGSLAIGIGATSAGFSFADSMLLRPLPISEPDRLVSISTINGTPFGRSPQISYPDYRDLRDRSRTFDGLLAASYAKFGFSPSADATPRMKFGMYVSGNFFSVLGVAPVLGRDFRPEEDLAEGRDPVVILGHDFWVSQFRGDPAVLGSRIRLDGVEFSIVGVAPEQFTSIDIFFKPALFVPMAMSARLSQQNILHDREAGWLFVKGRLKPGIGTEQAKAEVGAISTELLKLHAQADEGRRLQVLTEYQLRVQQSPPVVAMVTMLGGLGFCVLLVASANVAGLLLSRGRARSREIAIRLAIGAGRGALVRQLLIENLLLALAGGLAGVFLADAIAGFWRRMPIPFDVPLAWNIAVDRRALIFTLGVSVVSTLLFGLAPALRITRPDLVPALKSADADSAGKSRLWGRNTIVAGQVALSLVLLLVSAVLVQGFRNEYTQGPGFRIDHLFLTSFDTQLMHYTPDQSRRFFNDLLERTRSAAGVRSAALTTAVPMLGFETVSMVPEGYQLERGEHAPLMVTAYVSEGYFSTMNIPVLRGRGILESDRETAPLVAVINDAMARRFWPEGDPIGRGIHIGGATGPLARIVGIARKSKYGWIAEPPLDCVYLPYRQHPHPALSLVTESDAPDAATLAPVLREVLRGLDPDMPVFDVRTMRDFYDLRAVRTPNMIAEVVTALGLMGLLLATVGLYGLVAYSVSRRTREIAIRMAIGADREVVTRMVLRQGLQLGVAGVLAGSVAGFFACRLATSAFSIAPFDHMNRLVFAAMPALLLAVTTLATWAPARRASRVDPMRALREE